MKNQTFVQDHILYLINEEKNIYSLIDNTIDSIGIRKISEHLLFLFEHNEEQKTLNQSQIYFLDFFHHYLRKNQLIMNNKQNVF